MATRASGRQHRAVDYNEKAVGSSGSGPAWARQIESGDAEAANQKENSKPAAPKHAPQRKSAPAVASKGRDAGLTRLPIEDAKAGKTGNSKARSQPGKELVPKAAGTQVLPGVTVKSRPTLSASAAPATADASGPAAQAKPAANKPGGSGGRGSSDGSGAAEASGKPGSGGGKRKAAAAPEDVARQDAKHASKSAPAAVAATGVDAKRRKAAALPPAPAAQAAAPQPKQPEQRRASGEAAVREECNEAQLPGSGADELVEQYAANFEALQLEYSKLQGLYEDLKAAKIDEEVGQLLEQQNKHVTEHGQKAAQLAEQYKAEAERQAALAVQLGGNAAVEQCARLQADLINCQQALVDKEGESLEKSKRLAEMQARLGFLERYARVYESHDKCIQTDPPPLASASAQFPSIQVQSSGVEMLQAHAMVPEGAGGGSMYKRPKPGAQPADPSYTLPGLSSAPAGAAAVLAAEAAAAADAAGGGAATTGSDMQLTAGDETHPQPQQHLAQQQQPQQLPDHLRRQSLQPVPQQQPPPQQQRRHSMMPVAGRVQHAAAGPGLRPASAESQVHPHPIPTAPAAGHRRVSAAPPQPLDRQLHFSESAPSSEARAGAQRALAPLPAVPEAEPESDAEPAAAEHQLPGPLPLEAVPAASNLQHPAVTAVTAAGVLPAGGVVGGTPGSVAPRHMAITALTGLVSTPLRGGFYQFTDHRHGFVFQLGPEREPDNTDLPRAGEHDPLLRYCSVSLGTAEALLPSYLKGTTYFRESERGNFISHLLDALAQK
ncbi:hypothetical protein ACK3TF_002906 [Chlorella vulgaris]